MEDIAQDMQDGSPRLTVPSIPMRLNEDTSTWEPIDTIVPQWKGGCQSSCISYSSAPMVDTRDWKPRWKNNTDLCWDYAKGWCPRGHYCSWKHVAAVVASLGVETVTRPRANSIPFTGDSNPWEQNWTYAWTSSDRYPQQNWNRANQVHYWNTGDGTYAGVHYNSARNTNWHNSTWRCPTKETAKKGKPNVYNARNSPARSTTKCEVNNTKCAVNAQIDLATDKSNLQKGDFDFRVRRFLYALQSREGQKKLEEAFNTIMVYTGKKAREDINNWSAYILTLLKKFAPEILVHKKEKIEKPESIEDITRCISELLVKMGMPGTCPFTKKKVDDIKVHCLDLLKNPGTASTHLQGIAREHKISEVPSLVSGDSDPEATFQTLVADGKDEDKISEVALRLYREVLQSCHLCPVGLKSEKSE